MARRKTLPESVRAKLALAERLAALRSELFGDRGGPEMARRLGIPVRTWYNYEGGVTVPAEVILKIIELTAVEAGWLLHGKDRSSASGCRNEASAAVRPPSTVGALLRTALQLLEKERAGWPSATDGRRDQIRPPPDAGERAACPASMRERPISRKTARRGRPRRGRSAVFAIAPGVARRPAR